MFWITVYKKLGCVKFKQNSSQKTLFTAEEYYYQQRKKPYLYAIAYTIEWILTNVNKSWKLYYSGCYHQT